MEADDEVKGNGNSYDYGARMHDPRVGRWLSIDPKASKYPELNPYNYTANNPILYVDYDGRDYGVYVNHKSKTIIIKQTIHSVKGRSAELANIGAKKWNAESGKWQYTVTKGKKTITYDIQFEISVQEHDSESERDNAFATDKTGEANVFGITEFKNDGLLGETSKRTGRNGVGFNHVEVEDNEMANETKTPFHEIGHTLGLVHFTCGIMEEGTARVIDPMAENLVLRNDNNYDVTKANVSKILERSGIGSALESEFDYKIENDTGQENASQHSEKRAPKNFSTGKVEKKAP